MTTKILIIDDDQYTRQVLGKILSRDKQTAKLNPEIIGASDGVDGVKKFLEHKPQLAIIDLFMPKMDGFGVCRKMRETASPAELTIAVTSGVYKDPSIAAKLKEDFGAHFFAKPYQLKHIAAFVAKSLGAGVEPEAEHESSSVVAKTGALSPTKTAARLFWDLMEEEATGRLVLRRGQVVRQIELFVGHPIKVTTNVREETLGNFLVERGRIDKATQRSAMALAASTNKRLGEALIELGILTPQMLIGELTAQTRHKLIKALRWADGEWTFREGEPRNSNSNALDFAEVIVTGLAAETRVQSPEDSISGLSQRPLRINDRGRIILQQIASSVSPEFAEKFRPDITMEEFRQAGVSRAHLFRGLDVLLRCGGLEVGAPIVDDANVSTGHGGRVDLNALAPGRAKRGSQADLYSGLFDSDMPVVTRSASNPLEKLGSELLWKGPSADAAEAGSGLLEIADIIEDKAARAPTPALERDDQNFDEDSVVSVSFSSVGPNEEYLERKQELLTEFLRIHDKSLYEVLDVSATAPSDEIQAAYDALSKQFSKEVYTAELLDRDYGKLNVVLTTYDKARDVLLNEAERQRYDDTFHGSTQDLPNAPSMDADLSFQEAEQDLSNGNTEAAIAKLSKAIELSPEEPAYHATLGWAVFVAGGQDAHAADAARPHLNHALTLAPDSGLVHEYKGLVHAKLGDDPDAALMHLTKALDADPRRGHALAAVESIYLGRNQHRDLDRLYRRLLFRIGQDANAEGAIIWRRMGDLQNHYLRNQEQALVAYREARKRTPEDAELEALCKSLAESGPTAFFESLDELRAQWRSAPTTYAPLLKMYELAESKEHYDGQFLIASALAGLDQADAKQVAMYRRFRPRFLLRAQRFMEQKHWERVLHGQDFALVGGLYALLGDTIAELHPSAEANEEVAKADEIPDASLSPEFRTVRAYVAHMLGVPEPAIFSRVDYGRSIHAASLRAPILLAGYDAITCTDKVELACRLGRAMSFLRPGRAIAAGCPTRVLKSAMMACYSLGAPSANIPDPEGTIASFREAIGELDAMRRTHALEVVAHISREYPTLNLSRWTRHLARTADRCGLLFCGDLPMAVKCQDESSGGMATIDLMDFGLSSTYMRLRADLGLSIEV